jgi:predicted nucleotidyltransferase
MIDAAHIIRLSEHIARDFDPDRIILFGSHAYGTPAENSDVDLLVIMPLEGKSRDKRLDIWDRARPPFAVDILVRRPEDTQRRYREWDPLIREAIDHGKVLYERYGARVGRQGSS